MKFETIMRSYIKNIEIIIISIICIASTNCKGYSIPEPVHIKSAQGLVNNDALEFWKNIPPKIIRQIKVNSTIGTYLPFGNEKFFVVGSDYSGLKYLLLSELAYAEFQFETYDAFGKRFPGLLLVKCNKDQYLLPFSSESVRFVHINESGIIQTKDLAREGQDYIKNINALLSQGVSDDTFYSLFSYLNKHSVNAIPWQLPKSQKIHQMVHRKKPDKPVHNVIKSNQWINKFPIAPERTYAAKFVKNRQKQYPNEYKSETDIERHIRLMSPNADIVTSPFHLAVMEQLRSETSFSKYSLQEALTDLFVFNYGEPSNRTVTKIGGLPYWPKAKKWPTDEAGQPMIFIGQLNFLDSADHIGTLPGDILLVFGSESLGEYMMPSDSESLKFIWQNLSENANLVQLKDIPDTSWQLSSIWGDLYRTKDYIEESELELSEDEEHIFDLFVWQGTKIGGEPYWIQEIECIGSRFIGAIGSISPKSVKPYPFLNKEIPISKEVDNTWDLLTGLLMWGDGGILYLFLEEDGEICHTVQCY
ncbi:MAG: DUF1963 domain-containing protein [Bacteroidetes bacterium]|nr:DUF1963 domain-containing protein [Bacteroidota bacterium]